MARCVVPSPLLRAHGALLLDHRTLTHQMSIVDSCVHQESQLVTPGARHMPTRSRQVNHIREEWARAGQPLTGSRAVNPVVEDSFRGFSEVDATTQRKLRSAALRVRSEYLLRTTQKRRTILYEISFPGKSPNCGCKVFAFDRGVEHFSHPVRARARWN